MRREGSKDRPFYRIVVADSRFPRDGRYIEAVGTHDPMQDGENYNLDLEKIDSWVGKGAQPSDTVKTIIKRARKAAPAS